jgi:hypothetical protein
VTRGVAPPRAPLPTLSIRVYRIPSLDSLVCLACHVVCGSLITDLYQNRLECTRMDWNVLE